MDKAKLINSLKSFEDEFLQSSLRIINAGNRKLYTLDLFSTAINNRSLQLLKGFITLIESKNYLAAVPLIRLQLDNALRFFASTLVKDYDNLFMHYLEGKPFGQYKDAKGNRLTDSYLARELDKLFNGTHNLYKETSGYIHLSEKHFLASFKAKNSKKMSLQLNVGPGSDNLSEDDKVNIIRTMLEVSKLVIIVLEQWRHRKESLG